MGTLDDRNKYLEKIWYETLRRNEHIKPILIPMVKKPKAATIKAKRKRTEEEMKLIKFFEEVLREGGTKEIDGITWKITVE